MQLTVRRTLCDLEVGRIYVGFEAQINVVCCFHMSRMTRIETRRHHGSSSVGTHVFDCVASHAAVASCVILMAAL